MPSRRWPRIVAVPIVGLVLAACTTPETVDHASPTPQGSARPTSPAPTPTARLASGEPLPAGCDDPRPRADQTVAFVAEGRAWAMDPARGRLTCLFTVDDAAPFAWGPQGDRVLLGGLEIRGVIPDAPAYPGTDVQLGTFDWGHPLGLAVVFAETGHRVPEKRFMEDGHVERLPGMPRGTYLDIGYHPSGLALAFAIEQEGEESIWLSTNEGTEPERLVFSEGGTRFPSLAFTPDGASLAWIAQHLNTYQVHRMDLADRTGFEDGWRGELGEEGSNLHLAPEGDLMALDVGTSCDDRRALAVLSPTVARSVVPGETRPTTVVGWLDRSTVLVAAGGCDEPLDLAAVDVVDQSVVDLVHGVEVAASRAPAPPAPDAVPVPPEEAPPPPPEGVG